MRYAGKCASRTIPPAPMMVTGRSVLGNRYGIGSILWQSNPAPQPERLESLVDSALRNGGGPSAANDLQTYPHF